MSGELCFSCFADIAFQLHGQTPANYNAEIKRYTGAIYEGLSVSCGHCDSTATYTRNKGGDKWLQNYVTKEWPI